MGLTALMGGVVLWAVAAENAQGLPAPNGASQPIHTRQTLFAIPFRMDASARSGRDPIQVLLYVSTNRGATWELNSQVEPEKGHFLFRAGSDGEFWFILRTAVRGSPMQTPIHEKPGLRVIVDTVPPKLELVAQRGSSGQLVVRWRITETHVKPESLTIQYRADPEKLWQSVAIDRPPDGAAGPEYVGEATWWQPGVMERVEIRGEVADLAGNTAVSHAQVGAGLGAIPRPRPAPDAPPSPNPSAPSRGAGLPQLNSPEGPLQGRLPSSAWRPVRSAQGPAATLIRSPAAPVVASPHAAVHSAPSGDGDVPRLRVVNSPTFALEYDLGATPPTSDQQVEFWCTRDGGRTWLNYGTDPDRRSPMAVTVSEEGVYGFRIGVRRGGEGAAPPNGAAPDLWVVVRANLPAADTPPPFPGRILDARAVSPARPGQPSGL